MKASDIIKELQEYIEFYGDYEVILRECDDDMDIDIMSTYYDEDAERIVLSDAIWWD